MPGGTTEHALERHQRGQQEGGLLRSEAAGERCLELAGKAAQDDAPPARLELDHAGKGAAVDETESKGPRRSPKPASLLRGFDADAGQQPSEIHGRAGEKDRAGEGAQGLRPDRLEVEVPAQLSEVD